MLRSLFIVHLNAGSDWQAHQKLSAVYHIVGCIADNGLYCLRYCWL
jgi:hypothetical protein